MKPHFGSRTISRLGRRLLVLRTRITAGVPLIGDGCAVCLRRVLSSKKKLRVRAQPVLVKTRQAYQCICLQLGARAKRLSLDWVRRGEREVMEMNRQLQETDATLSGSERRFKLRLDKWQSVRECCGAKSPVSSARAFGNTGGCLKLRLSPIAFGNQTISLTARPMFRHCGKETHGFASLPRGRFAIYRVQSFKRSLALPCLSTAGATP
jgi:hypothetical protein